MVRITFDKSFFYGIAALLAVGAVLGIGWLVARPASQQAADPPPPVQPAAQAIAPDASGAGAAQPPSNVAQPPAGGAPVDIAPAPANDGSLESVLAGGEITPEQAAAISRIAPNEALEKLADPGVLWLDVRTADEFAVSRIPGAVSYPAYTDDGRLAELPKDKEILVYCA